MASKRETTPAGSPGVVSQQTSPARRFSSTGRPSQRDYLAAYGGADEHETWRQRVRRERQLEAETEAFVDAIVERVLIRLRGEAL
jgi:hypothetical protein